MSKQNSSIAIIDAAGTGTEVTRIFKDSTLYIMSLWHPGCELSFPSFYEESSSLINSYNSLTSEYNATTNSLYEKMANEKNQYKNFLRKHRTQVKGVFRAAINAQTLYEIRQELSILKFNTFEFNSNGRMKKILFFRDQTQGYYANKKITADSEQIGFAGNFSLKGFQSIFKFVSDAISLEQNVNDETIFSYKYHLFDNSLESLITRAAKDSNLREFSILQPDSTINYLLNEFTRSETVNTISLVCGNEIGDTLLEMLIHSYNLGNYKTFFTSNYILSMDNLEVLQTMHGSADSLEGTFKLNPCAALNASAYACEKWLGVVGAQNSMKNALLATDAANSDRHKNFDNRVLLDNIYSHLKKSSLTCDERNAEVLN